LPDKVPDGETEGHSGDYNNASLFGEHNNYIDYLTDNLKDHHKVLSFLAIFR